MIVPHACVVRELIRSFAIDGLDVSIDFDDDASFRVTVSSGYGRGILFARSERFHLRHNAASCMVRAANWTRGVQLAMCEFPERFVRRAA